MNLSSISIWSLFLALGTGSLHSAHASRCHILTEGFIQKEYSELKGLIRFLEAQSGKREYRQDPKTGFRVVEQTIRIRLGDVGGTPLWGEMVLEFDLPFERQTAGPLAPLLPLAPLSMTGPMTVRLRFPNGPSKEDTLRRVYAVVYASQIPVLNPLASALQKTWWDWERLHESDSEDGTILGPIVGETATNASSIASFTFAKSQDAWITIGTFFEALLPLLARYQG